MGQSQRREKVQPETSKEKTLVCSSIGSRISAQCGRTVVAISAKELFVPGRETLVPALSSICPMDESSILGYLETMG